jgi:ParB-like nuclease domain
MKHQIVTSKFPTDGKEQLAAVAHPAAPEATAQEAPVTKPQTTKRPVHPIADLLPMMTDEELANLAADIKANGLIHPVVLDENGVLLDGRDRDRACQIAGIEPTTVLFEGDDPRAYIIANNISRRHLTKGQQAMALAMIYPMPEKGGRGKKKTMDETSTLFSPKRLQLARTVLAHSADLAQAVLAGSKSLDGAYDEARKAKQPLGAQVAGNVRREVARSKKVAVLTAHSACDPEDHFKTSDGTEEIELGKVIARLRRDQPRNTDTMRICDALERRLKRP